MKNLILSFSLIGVLLLYPIQNVNAFSWEEAWDKANEYGNQGVKKFNDTMTSVAKIVSQIPECMEKFEDDRDADCTNVISKELYKISRSNPTEFFNLILSIPQLGEMFNHYLDKKMTEELEKISPELKKLGLDSYPSSVTKNFLEFGHTQLLVNIGEDEIDRLEKNQGFMPELIITSSKSFFTYDLETGKIITLDEYARKIVEQNPPLRNSDFGKDPVRVALMLFFDGEHFLVTPIIPISDEKLISLEEYCKLEIDDQMCEKAKAYLKLASMASKVRNPTLFVPAMKAFLGIIQEINNETNAGLDEEIIFVNDLLSIQPQTLANTKLIPTNDGEYISLNQASTLEYDEETIGIAQSALNYMSNDENRKKEQLEQDLITIINAIDKLSNK